MQKNQTKQESKACLCQNDFNPQSIRSQFPLLKHPHLVYLDSAATAQKPDCVIQAIQSFYSSENANVHRGLYPLSAQATLKYEHIRKKISHYLNAQNAEEIIFTKGTTEGINLLAQTYGKMNLKTGDDIILTRTEHHSNIVPWQLIAQSTGANIKVVELTPTLELDLELYKKILSPKTKIVSLGHVSNALGTINPIQEMTKMAKAYGATVIIDGAQAIPHLKVDVQALGCDFYVFSGHKLFGPTGIGVIWGKKNKWEGLPPYQGGGNMIQKVTFNHTSYKNMPDLYEAGTPHIEGVFGLGAAIDFLNTINHHQSFQYEQSLVEDATQQLERIPGVKVLGLGPKAGIVSFIIEGIHPHDITEVLALEGVAIRGGHHCTQPLMEYLCISGTNRASFCFYNTPEEVVRLCLAVEKAKRLFS